MGMRFINHWLNAVDEHSLQAPFVYQFCTEVVKNTVHNQSYLAVQQLRTQLNRDRTSISYRDFGAGNHSVANKTIGHISRTSHQPKVAHLLYSIAQHFKPNSILELGTSLGLSTLCMASAVPEANITTLEGSQSLSKLANDHFELLGATQVHSVVGNIDHTLDEVLNQLEVIDLLFMDANHQHHATITYLDKCIPKFHEHTIVVMDDIHWSDPMEKAWKEIIAYSNVTLSIDLFYAGVLFFRPELNKSNVILSL